MEKKINWKNLGWTALKVFVIFILNSALWVFIILNVIQVGDSEFDYWLALTSKGVHKVLIESYNLPPFHYYTKFLVYFFIVVGLLLSYMWLKLLYVEHKKDKRVKETNDSNEKIFKKIFGKE